MMKSLRILFIYLLMVVPLLADGTLTPGTTPPASWAPTAAPAPRGNPGDFGYEFMSSGRWSGCASWDTFTTTRTIGIQTYHTSGDGRTDQKGGIYRVTFYNNDGPQNGLEK